MQDIKFFENEIAECQSSLQDTNESINNIDRQCRALLEEQGNLTNGEIAQGKRQAKRRARAELVGQLEDFETIKDNLEKEIKHLSACRELALLLPRVKEYRESAESYLKTYTDFKGKIKELASLKEEVITMAESFAEMQHPLQFLGAINNRVAALGFNTSSFLQEKVVALGQGPNLTEELNKFDITVDVPEMEKTTRALDDVKSRLNANVRMYSNQFAATRKDAPVLQSGKMKGRMATRVISRDTVPDIVKRPQNYYEQDQIKAGVNP